MSIVTNYEIAKKENKRLVNLSIKLRQALEHCKVQRDFLRTINYDPLLNKKEIEEKHELEIKAILEAADEFK